jgi:hypothetical protein
MNNKSGRNDKKVSDAEGNLVEPAPGEENRIQPAEDDNYLSLEASIYNEDD